MNMKYLILSFGLLAANFGFAQEEIEELEPIHSFLDTRVINGHSVEVLEDQTLDLRITHRFGDIATYGSMRTLWGLDQSSDIRIGFEYGLKDKFQIGLGRSKGGNVYSEFWDGHFKYKFLTQTKDMPVSASLVLSSFYTSMRIGSDSTSATYFQKTAHRFSYVSQLIVSKKFGERVSVQIAPSYSHRNFVEYTDQNGLFSLGTALRVGVSEKTSLIAEYYHNFNQNRTSNGREFSSPLGVGVEIKTFAHTFQMNFMNSRGITEGQFIPLTQSSWLDGEFRLGFTISRHF